MKQFFAYCFFVLGLLGVAFRQLHPVTEAPVKKHKVVVIQLKDPLAVK